MSSTTRPDEYVRAIQRSGLSIYDAIEVGSDLYIPSAELEKILDSGLRGFSTKGLAIRTRSKVVKSEICKVIGYPVPTSFRKEQPRFPGQNFDTYVQSANNLQIWNEELSATRRYVLIQEKGSVLTKVRVVTGETLAVLDTTGTLTQKYQARLVPGAVDAELITTTDTAHILPVLADGGAVCVAKSPTDYPEPQKLLPISTVFERLRGLIGRSFPDAGRDQERNRGAGLHRLVCEALGYGNYQDDGRFPDVKHQLVEVKLQTSPTIDLGLVTPSSTSPLDIPKVGDVQIRHADVRYALFDAVTDGKDVTLRRLYLTTGEGFFARFPQFQGKVLNKKLQIPLPTGFFGHTESIPDLLL